MRATTRAALSRRAALLTPLGAAGCSLLDNWFGENKPPLPGEREAILARRRGMQVDGDASRKIVLPPPVRNEAWPQTGGNPAHFMGHLSAGEALREAWSASIGEGGGYRAKILAQPLIVGDTVFAMDSDAVVSAFATADGHRRWRSPTTTDEDDSTNVGGGMAVENDTLYAVNGLGQLVAFDPANGKERYRIYLGAPARSAPTVADGRLFVTTIQEKLLALAADDGRKLWEHQAPSSNSSMLGLPAPGYADGLVVAGFGSGELAALRAETGGVSWTDSLASARGRNSISDLSAIRGLPVLAERRVYTIGLGGLLISSDLRSGRRLWEREIGGQDSPWAAGEWLFILNADQELGAVSREDGRIAWVTELPRWDNPEKQQDPIYWFGPALVGDRLLISGTGQEALSVSPYSGEILGRQQLSGPASLPPVVAADTVYVITDDGKLLALR
ncbi:MAG: PQQ-binding-like beta-propeller repeat protein [Acetobacteraceae bacterium]|nr:PQQ-binding-like beta-propeller repeat protein [Acetobacteraceae bacterium]